MFKSLYMQVIILFTMLYKWLLCQYVIKEYSKIAFTTFTYFEPRLSVLLGFTSERDITLLLGSSMGNFIQLKPVQLMLPWC